MRTPRRQSTEPADRPNGRAGVLDLIVRHGTVIDGSGAPAFSADVGVQDGTIAWLGDLSDAAASQELEATGLVVAPGFIDIHSHSDFTLLVDPRAHSSVAQGVTTELIGNCGHGCAPVADVETVKGNIYGYGPEPPITWTSMGGYLRTLEGARPAVNVLTLVPNGMLCRAALGLNDRSPTPAELRRMGRLLEEGLLRHRADCRALQDRGPTRGALCAPSSKQGCRGAGGDRRGSPDCRSERRAPAYSPFGAAAGRASRCQCPGVRPDRSGGRVRIGRVNRHAH
ncbi:MAG: hypothetical protein E6H03_10685, partial [Bacillati bacterium ANGP1]